MPKFTGITEKTYNNMIIDAGEVRLDYVDGTDTGTLLGATRGGNSFTIETEYREMPADGAKGPVKGSRRITRVDARMTVNFVEFNPDIIGLALPGSEIADFPEVEPTHEEITRALQIALTDYHGSIALLGEVSGSNKPFIGILKNALADGNFEVSVVDNDEAVLAVQFTAHFDVEDLTEEPWAVRYPTEDEEEPETPPETPED